MPCRKRRGVDKERGGERERKLVKRKKKGWRMVGGFLGGLLLQFLPLSSTLRHPPLLCFFEGANKGRRKRKASFEGFGLFTLTERYCLLGTLSSVFFQWPPRMGFPLTVEDRMDPPVAGSSNVYIDRIKFSNRNNCFDNVTYA